MSGRAVIGFRGSWQRPMVLVKGAGDFASGVIHRLHRAGLGVVCTELERPLAVRRWVAFSEAVHEGEYTVEGVTARRCDPGDVHRIEGVVEAGKVALLVDPGCRIRELMDFDVVVDARSAKRNLGTGRSEAPVVVAIGPGFTAGKDCDAVVETLWGKGLGKVILEGRAAEYEETPTPLEGMVPLHLQTGHCGTPLGPDPGAEGDGTNREWIEEFLRRLVIRSPSEGTFRLEMDIGSEVEDGDMVGVVLDGDGAEHEVRSRAGGLIRGMIRDRTPVKEGMKLGDVDPTCEMEHLCTISEKARAIAGGVLEAVMFLLDRRRRDGLGI